MAVLGVCAPDAREVAHRLLPSATGEASTPEATVVTDGEFSANLAPIGAAPTSSSIAVTREGLELVRGASWSAPIYYRAKPTMMAASNLALLVRDEDEVDMERLAALAGYAVHRAESRSLYRNIHLVRPFETIVMSPRGIESTRGQPPLIGPEPKGSIDALATELWERLCNAVAKSAGNRRVGLMLSGGMDSSSILAALLAIRGASSKEICEVTLDFDAPGSDQPHVRALERHYGISVARLPPAQIDAGKALVLDAAPSRHHGDPWVIACAKRAHEMGAEVLMTGTGGDQFFGGDLGTATAIGLWQGDARGVWDALRARFPHRASVRHRLRVTAAALLRPYVPIPLRALRASLLARAIPEWVGPVLHAELERSYAERRTRPTSHDAQWRYEDSVTNPADSEYVAEARAQTDSASPIPRADPLYDDDLVRFLIGVRQQALFAGGTYRGLLRLATRGALPDSVRNRLDKSDFEPALADAVWPIESYAPMLSFEAIGRVGIVNANAFREYLDPLYRSPRAGENGERWLAFWPALAAETFLRS
jgi:asparagine synthetase B (glutamine-hydrolysing)